MLSRPKPGESEADLLKFQNEFLSVKASPAVKIVKKADKRRGDVESGDDERPPLQHDRDVVMLDDFPDEPPPLTPGPPKKSRFKSTHVRFEEDPGEQLDHADKHITAVFNKIIEHDTSSAKMTMPVFTGGPFPRVFHRSEIKTEVKSAQYRGKSIFAQKIAAKRAAELAQISVPADTDEVEEKNTGEAYPEGVLHPQSLKAPCNGDEEDNSLGSLCSGCSRIVTGEGLGSLAGEQEAQNIHKENLERLQSMSKEQILEEQKKLLAQLDPSLLAFLKSRHGTSTTEEGKEKMEHEKPSKLMHLETQPALQEEEEAHLSQNSVIEEETGIEKSLRTKVSTRIDVTGENCPLGQAVFQIVESSRDQYRFDEMRAGYSLEELFHLSRSQVIQQRTLALQVLSHVVQKAKAGEFATLLKGSVLRVLLDAGFLFLLRFSIDDTVDNVVAAAVHALHALLVYPEDEEYLDKTFSWYQGMTLHPFIPNNEEEEEEDAEEEELNATEKTAGRKLNDENKPDPELARYDVVKGLLKTKILHRIRYILEVMQPVPLVVLEILDILTRIARHSTEACSQVLDCPRLIETVVREFLPTQWNPRIAEPGQFLTSLHGVPCATAMKLIRVLASGGRNAAARLVLPLTQPSAYYLQLNKFEMKSQLSRFIAEEPQDLPLRTEDAIRINMEAFRLWAVAAGYGQACDLYRDLYPVLMKMVPSLSQLASNFLVNTATFELSVQRAAAIVTLLTQVTQTAGCRAELQAQLSRSDPKGGDLIPPPLVTWSQVSGFRPIIESNLKQCLKEISQLDTWQALQPLTAACVLYLGVYYNHCSLQPSVNTIDCLEEMEHLSSSVLLPVLSKPAMQTLWEMLR
ncbi:hypothetical protein JD844_021280 [Phrynosoma platyrhinos]|uniref:RNA polymerase II-associated protein 1 n=1 Tax=Phrynosoma platyrhinos TaxID=52577 RepID=A0ABQ7STH5_PHRPL|nr:hypothetical protein JD844_021280 [Phrynosoma platyrhinos]